MSKGIHAYRAATVRERFAPWRQDRLLTRAARLKKKSPKRVNNRSKQRASLHTLHGFFQNRGCGYCPILMGENFPERLRASGYLGIVDHLPQRLGQGLR